MRINGTNRLVPIWACTLLVLPFSLFYYQIKNGADVNSILQTKYSEKQKILSKTEEAQHVNIELRNQFHDKSSTKEFVIKKSSILVSNSDVDSDVTLNLSMHGDKSAKPLHSSLETKAIRNDSRNEECGYGPFHIPANFKSMCFVRAPKNYTHMYDRRTRLWMTSAENLGELNTSVPDYHNQVYNQKWLKLRKGRVIINKKGGTSVRKFGDNFEYFDILLNHTNIYKRCRNVTKPVILDTGAGISSVAAAARDGTGGGGSVNVLSYVPVDNYLRLGTIISDRGLPVYLHYYTGEQIPAPDSSFDMVHCRWCWHHVVGYDVWLDEVNRLLVPGGFFVFTFVPLEDTDLLPHKPWYAALERMPWDCIRTNKIVQICTKRKDNNLMNLSCGVSSLEVSKGFEEQVKEAFKIINENSESTDDTDRVLNVDCSSAQTCSFLEKALKKQNMFHTFRNDTNGKDELRKMINSGSVGILHDWNRPGPFYPRMFDVVHLSCDKSQPNLEILLIEIHRLLRPGGFVFALKSTCSNLNVLHDSANKTKFDSLRNDNTFFVGRRTNL